MLFSLVVDHLKYSGNYVDHWALM